MKRNWMKIIRKMIAVFVLALVLVLGGMLSPGTGTAAKAEDGKSLILQGWHQNGWSGNGTETDPFQVNHPQQLNWIANKVNYKIYNMYNLYFSLTADIDMAGVNYVPIGNHNNNGDYIEDSFAFGGVFDGNGHTISNLTISKRARYNGLFGTINQYGTVKNLTLSNCNIQGADAGGIAGWNEGRRIENCHVTGSLSVNSDIVGGIAGVFRGAGTISACTFSGTVTAGTEYCGGIVGKYSAGTLTNNVYTYQPGSDATGAVGIEGGTAGEDRDGATTAKCTLHFDANGGSGTMADIPVIKNTQYELPAMTFTPPAGKEYRGYWDHGSAGSMITVTEDVTIKPVWASKATMTFDLNGGSATSLNPTVLYLWMGEAFSFPTCPYKPPEGKKFAGWEMEDGSVKWAGDKITITQNSYTIKTLWEETVTWKNAVIHITENETINDRIEVIGNSTLVLHDGATLTVPKGIHVPPSASLTINGEGGANSGKLIINDVESHQAGIGGNYTVNGGSVNKERNGNITINGGTVTVTGGVNAAGIGGAYQASGGTITINGGIVTATGGTSAAGIGGGAMLMGGNSTISLLGGQVTAKSGSTSTSGTIYIGIGDQGKTATKLTLSWKNPTDKYLVTYFGKFSSVSVLKRIARIGNSTTYYDAGDYSDSSGIISINTNNFYPALDPHSISGTGDAANGGGSVSATVGDTTDVTTSASFGETVKLTVAINQGFTLGEVSYNDGTAHTLTADENGLYSFTMPDQDVSVSAPFMPNRYTVVFHPNLFGEYTGSMANQSFTYGTAQKLTVNAYDQTGCTFTGWNTEADGTGTAYTNQQELSNLTTEKNGVVELYAQWDMLPATAPTIGTQPSDLNLYEGYSAGNVLTVVASAAEDTGYALSYQWVQCDDAGKTNPREIENATEASYTVPTGKAIGSYYYYCVVTAARTDNGMTAEAASNVSAVTVMKKLAQSITASDVTVTYGDTGKSVSATTDGDGVLSYTLKSGDAVAVDDADGTLTIVKAGTAVITVTAAETDAYTQAARDVTVTVNPQSIGIPTAITGLKWTGGELTGVADGNGYTVTDGKKTDVGSYTAMATLSSTTNYQWSDNTTEPKTISWSIAKADGPAAPTELEGIAPTSEGSSDGKITGVTAAMEYASKTDFSDKTDCTGTEITGLSAGTYYVRLKETETHEAGAAATVTVPAYGVKTITATATGFIGTYDGQAHGINISVTDPASGATIEYGTTIGTYDLTASPTITNVTDSPLTVHYRITAEGYNPLTGSATVTISKADLVVTAPKPVEGLVYTGSALELITAGSVENDAGTLWYAVRSDESIPKDEEYTTSIPAKTDAGNYYVWYKAAGDRNHNDTEPDCVTVTIAAAENPDPQETVYTVTVTVSDEKTGTAAADPTSGISGTAVNLTQTANKGYVFKEWKVISGGVQIADNRFVIGTANVEIEAVFEAEIQEQILDQVTKNGIVYQLNHKQKTAAVVKPAKKTITKATIPATVKANNTTYKVTEIKAKAFKGKTKLTAVKIGKNVKTVGANAFYGCTKLSKVTGMAAVTTIGDGAFGKCKVLVKITIPAKVTKIGAKAFYGCVKLKMVSGMKAVTSIGASTFEGCKAMVKFTIPAKVTKIGAKAFWNCSGLKTLTIQTAKLTAKNVGANAFNTKNKKTVYKVPAKKLKAYRKWMVKKGVPDQKQVQ